ncbi:oxidoreductase [Actinomadura madurae]|uniref:oxidoreductase n=1 Tax=Actinomadura madurae TaxID=1993 RepID=UPI002025CBEF|nr:oxidoreductase [Actinomadura madurae]MCP9948890.1 oxidoreductase [Actinomadura madurae]MCP9978135.1 oxidoreductase [Actinomadura madurae]MCQ0010345.1 oxidoreductase [Actinomadura madurae]URM94499.1 oxidoreductase [Actinomadura madurae]URN05210.1 oxidoreductase [Actinomadura madurae]
MGGWTAGDIPDLRGRRAIVTGANSGIGYHTALQLAKHGASVVLACRSAERGQAAFDRVKVAAPGADVALGSLDLADLSSVRTFAARHGDAPLDILVNNAGVMALPRRSTADGFEMQFGTNHLGHFALTGLLLSALRAAPSARVVTVTSAFAWSGRLRFDDLQGERGYRKWSAYSQAKLANLVFAKELDRRVPEVTSVAAHPGYAATNLQQTGPRMQGNSLMEKVTGVGNALMAQSAAAGALPSLYAATAPDAKGGGCYGPRLLQYRGSPTEVVTPPQADRPGLGDRLWEVSETLTGVTYAQEPA